MYSSTTGPRRVRRGKVQEMSAEVSDSNVRSPALRPRSVGRYSKLRRALRQRVAGLKPALVNCGFLC
jgi:hypothetical protein